MRRSQLRLLVFFHGDSLAHTIRPLVMARALRQRGYRVEFAGRGSHQARVAAEGFVVHDLETMPQRRMDEYVARGDYGYYDLEWIDRCVRAERALLGRLQPDLCVADLRPTLRVTAALEGRDLALVEAGYNQPGYPFPILLPEWFSRTAGPFDEYLVQQGTPWQPHRLLYLVADVPEFHPAGASPLAAYQYVGPLIEDELPEPDTISALSDTGWDATLPLIVINGGSTGAAAVLAACAVAELRLLPCRLLVTTAGQGAALDPSPQLRVVDYLPAAWTMRRAALLVGVGGIGSIYQALRQGVPVVGAPEHLDQEYHLNRVQELGLGLKLDWEQLRRPGCLRAAVEAILAQYDAFRGRCQAFSGHIRRWSGGEAAADAVDRFLLLRQSPDRIDVAHLLAEDDFLRQLESSTPPDLTGATLRGLLRRNLSRGLPHARRGHRLFFDRRDSWNWLYDTEPRFFEADYRAMEQKRRGYFVLDGDRLSVRRPVQRYRLTYRYRIVPGSLPPDRPALLFLPYPLVTGYQHCIRLCGCQPDDLRDYLLPGAGFIYAYPFAISPGQRELLEFGYTCELTVLARLRQRAPLLQALPAPEQRRYTALDPELAGDRMVAHFLEQLALDPALPVFERVRRLYLALAGQKRFKKTKERCQCPGCSTRVVLGDSGAHCITLARAFITLCRALDIPAREVTGALAGYPVGQDCYVSAGANEGSLWGHTWAEVFVPEYGWLPVEFHGIAIAVQAMTARNVADPALRREITAQSEAYLDYYLGNLDCHRVVGSNGAKQLPTVLLQEVDPAGVPRVAPPADLHYECSLEFACL